VTQYRQERSTVFVIEDDDAVRESLVALFKLADLQVEAFQTGKEFLANYDSSLPGMSGTEVHEQLANTGIYLPTVFLTGHAPPDMSDDARGRGVVAVFEKPCRPERLIEAVRSAIGED
jgi:FixJ family two-component response regulator